MKTLTTVFAAALMATVSLPAQAWDIESTYTGTPGGPPPPCGSHPVGSTWITPALPGALDTCGNPAKHLIHKCVNLAQGLPPELPCTPHAHAAKSQTAHDSNVAAHDKAVAAHDKAVAHERTLQQLRGVEKDPKLADPAFDGRREPGVVDGTTRPKRDPSGDNAETYKGSGATKKLKPAAPPPSPDLR